VLGTHKERGIVVIIRDTDFQDSIILVGWRSQIARLDVQRVVPEFSSQRPHSLNSRRRVVNSLQPKQVCGPILILLTFRAFEFYHGVRIEYYT